jgi:hypothetical protein
LSALFINSLSITTGKTLTIGRFVMTQSCVGDEQLGRLLNKFRDLIRRVEQGTLPFHETMHHLQMLLIEDRFIDPGRIVQVDYDISANEVIEKKFRALRSDGSIYLGGNLPFKPCKKKGKRDIKMVLVPASVMMKFELTDLVEAELIEGLAFFESYPEVVRELTEMKKKRRIKFSGSAKNQTACFGGHEILYDHGAGNSMTQSVKLFQEYREHSERDLLLCINDVL